MTAGGDRRDDGPFQRWSRLKGERRSEAPPVDDAENAVAAADGGAPPEEPQTAPDEDALADLPDIESLDKDSDYTVFMRDGVPEALRQKALRKLWLSDPVLANLDGLNDYDDDFAAILKEGAAYMQRLVDAGERLTRPGADDGPDPEPDGEARVKAAPEDAPAGSPPPDGEDPA